MAQAADDRTRKKQRLILSASQLETAEDCLRKWWLQRVAKLPERPKGHPYLLARTLGDVLHEVMDRYLSADHLGRGPNGKPVNLYPDKRKTTAGWLPWTSVVSKFGADKGEVRSVTPKEAELIQKLVRAAIDQGVIIRAPDGKVESRFDYKLFETEDFHVWITGYRDYIPSRDVVEDHKTCKKNKAPWKKTAKKIHANMQMRVYGKTLLLDAEARGEPLPAEITLCHNQFVKDPNQPVVDKRPVKITREALDTHWTSKVLPLAHKIAKVKKVKRWEDIEEPEADVCNKYGGCPFMRVCSGEWSLDRYRKRIERQSRQVSMPTPKVGCRSKSVTSPTSKKGNNMGFMDKLAKKKAKKAALNGDAAPAPKSKEKPKADPKPTPKKEEPIRGRVVGDVPPWANPECRGCSGTGFSSSGKPCRICDARAPKAGRPLSSTFEIVVEDGVIVWSDGETDGSAELVTEEVEVKETKVEEVVEEEPKAEEPLVEEPKTKKKKKGKLPSKAKARQDEVEKRGRGRPKKGFTLLIDCFPTKGTGKIGGGSGVHDLTEVIHRYGALMAEENEVDSFYEIDAFTRRDALCAVASHMADEFGTDYVVASSNNVEERELIRVLKPLASTVIGRI